MNNGATLTDGETYRLQLRFVSQSTTNPKTMLANFITFVYDSTKSIQVSYFASDLNTSSYTSTNSTVEENTSYEVLLPTVVVYSDSREEECGIE